MKNRGSAIWSASILMATSAIGPGFLTQTTVFTRNLLYDFGFIVFISVVIDVLAQTSIWRAIGISGRNIQTLGNSLVSVLGSVISILVIIGGMVFNIGNIAGTGLGLETIFGLKPLIGAILSVITVLIVFFIEDSQKVLDVFVKILAIVMLFFMILLAFKANLDFKMVVGGTFWPEKFDIKSTLTLVGGTVGGYISFAGAQKLLDGGITGTKNLGRISKSASAGILTTGIMRYLLFIGTLGVVLGGGVLNPENPTASVFFISFGEFGKIFFGIVLWSAAITSVLGATYTSFSFFKNLHPRFYESKKIFIFIFLAISTCIYLIIGKPVNLLLFAGYINSFILPLGLIISLLSFQNKKIFKDYTPSNWLIFPSWILVFLLIGFSFYSLKI
ncbi:MAG: divalent metal cation transporter [Cytophagaceae bacterium]|nr:divalent metal cation transporter [Cytophagaceae bacterium]MBL0303902.1 divalent metal cation transporter [Cytophagaceae bacterium]